MRTCSRACSRRSSAAMPAWRARRSRPTSRSRRSSTQLRSGGMGDLGVVTVEPAATPAPRFRKARLARTLAPYGLLLPTVVVIGGVLGYPLYLLVKLSFEHYGLFQLIQHKGQWVGLGNYRQILHDHEFWVVLLRTLLFTAVNVGLTMV